MIEFIDYNRFYAKEKTISIQINNVIFDVKIKPLSHLFEYQLIKLHERLVNDRKTTDLSEYIAMLDLCLQDGKEHVYKYLWEKYKETDLFTYLYGVILEEFIMPYYQIMADSKTQEYLKYGEYKQEKESKQDEVLKQFDELYFDLMQIKEPDISLYGAMILLHYRRRKEARDSIETVSQIQACLIDLLLWYTRTDKSESKPNNVKDLIDNYKLVLGKNKYITKVMSYLDIAKMHEEAKNGKQ